MVCLLSCRLAAIALRILLCFLRTTCPWISWTAELGLPRSDPGLCGTDAASTSVERIRPPGPRPGFTLFRSIPWFLAILLADREALIGREPLCDPASPVVA